MSTKIKYEPKTKYSILLFAVSFLWSLLLVLSVSPIFGQTHAKAQISTNARNLAGLIAVDRITGDGGGTSSLGDLLVLNGLFGTGTTGTTSTSARNLAGLIAVDRIVGNGGSFGSSGTSSLGDLIVLNGLFGTNGTIGTSTSARNLAGLIAVDRVTGGGGAFGGGAGTTDLGSLIVLNGIFDP